MYKKIIEAFLEGRRQDFDESVDLLVTRNVNTKNYHSGATGDLHYLGNAGDTAWYIFEFGAEDMYPMARRLLRKLCLLQDTRQDSRTFGLWSYVLEEPLDAMKAPDYNAATFRARVLIDICQNHADKVDGELLEMMKTAIRNAVKCTIKRNVGLDYSNIIVMSTLTLVAAAELLEDAELLALGKKRLRNFCSYTKFNGTLTEYNSPNYGRLALGDIARMLKLFRDEECRQMAMYLNEVVWTMLARHYNIHINQLAPPQMRAYQDVDGGGLAWFIWQGTGGRYGKCPDTFEQLRSVVSLEEVCCNPQCPASVLPLFEADERVVEEAFYKQNDLREPDEDRTIIREADSPDLWAYSYQTPAYSMGAFRLCDTWNQRRNVMIEWDADAPKSFRLRGIHNGYDYCSGMVYTGMEKNRILGQLGMVTDRGSYHYILDKDKSGVYDAEELGFRFELGGNCENIAIEADGKDFYIRDCGLTIKLHVEAWVYDGKDAPVYVSEDGKMVILEGYKGESKQIDTTALAETCGVFTMTVEDAAHKAEPAELIWQLEGETLRSHWGELAVESPAKPVVYREALGLKA